MKTIIDHPSLGEITVLQSRRSRRISLFVRPPSHIRLSVPANVSLKEACAFAERNEEWIRGVMNKYSGHPALAPKVITMPFSTRRHSLLMRREKCDAVRGQVHRGMITVTFPENLSPDDRRVQGIVKKGIEEAWRREAAEYLPVRARELANRCGLRYNRLSVRNTVSRWGSCSSDDNISLSLHLMRLPDHLIDYIIIHELCHTIHRNHGPEFHALLDRLTSGNHASLRKEMKEYSPRW